MTLADNIWWTRKARIETEKRLLSNAFQAQLLLLWYSFISTGASIYYVKFNTNSEYSGISWVVFSVLTLCISGFINGFSFKERAALIKECYETLHTLYNKAIDPLNNPNSIAIEYSQILGVCENHTDMDFRRALCKEYISHPHPADPKRGLSKVPTKYIWCIVVANILIRFLLFSTLYALPVALFFLVEQIKCP